MAYFRLQKQGFNHAFCSNFGDNSGNDFAVIIGRGEWVSKTKKHTLLAYVLTRAGGAFGLKWQ